MNLLKNSFGVTDEGVDGHVEGRRSAGINYYQHF